METSTDQLELIRLRVANADLVETLQKAFELLDNSEVRHFISTNLGEQARLHAVLNAIRKATRTRA